MGFLSEVFKIAAGVAVGNKVSREKQNDGSGRQNLLGCAGCAVTQGKYTSCVHGAGCNLSHRCTQDGRYKIGE